MLTFEIIIIPSNQIACVSFPLILVHSLSFHSMWLMWPVHIHTHKLRERLQDRRRSEVPGMLLLQTGALTKISHKHGQRVQNHALLLGGTQTPAQLLKVLILLQNSIPELIGLEDARSFFQWLPTWPCVLLLLPGSPTGLCPGLLPLSVPWL